MPAPPDPRVFVSHEAGDSAMAEAVCDRILGPLAGVDDHEIFAAHAGRHRIHGGQNWWESVVAATRTADCFVFLVTPSFLRSGFCYAEVGAWWARGVNVVPILFPPLQQRDTGLDVFQPKQVVEASRPFAREVAGLVAASLGRSAATMTADDDAETSAAIRALQAAAPRPGLTPLDFPVPESRPLLPSIDVVDRSAGEAGLTVVNPTAESFDIRVRIGRSEGCYVADPAALEGVLAPGESRGVSLFRSAGFSRILVDLSWDGGQSWLGGWEYNVDWRTA